MVLMPGALDILDRIAGEHPGLKLVIDHVGLERARQGAPGRSTICPRSARWPSIRTSR